MVVYFNGDYISRDQVRLSPDDRGFLFGDGVYEVMRVYRGKVFVPDYHVERLKRSLSELKIDGFDAADLVAIGQELLATNQLDSSDALCYLQVTRGAAPRKHSFPNPPVAPTVYGFVRAVPYPDPKTQSGATVVTCPDLRWRRCDIKSVNLLGNVLAAQQAADKGADEAILIRDGLVTEGGATSVAAVIDGQVVTHPESPLILSGITRRVALDLCAELGITVQQRALRPEELLRASEVFLMGTTIEVWPISKIDGTALAELPPDSVSSKLRMAFDELIQSMD